jgi:flavin reductase (DIM6/NTAB) family NADH-FMN oxidoreductase RutF
MKSASLVQSDDQRAYRQALGRFATGVTLIIGRDRRGVAHGLVVNSFTSVSLAPPIILWCLGASSGAAGVFADLESFSVNVLGFDQEALARRYSAPGDRLIPEDMLLTKGVGAPLLKSALLGLDCRSIRRTEMGDHHVLFGEVASFRASSGDALGFFKGRFLKLCTGDD